MSYKPMNTAPRGVQVCVLTRACNTPRCWIREDGSTAYQSVHGEWHNTDRDPPQQWWDGPVPGWPSGRGRAPNEKETSDV